MDINGIFDNTLRKMQSGARMGDAFAASVVEETEARSRVEKDPARAAAIEIADKGSMDLLVAITAAKSWMPGMNKSHEDYKTGIDGMAAIIRKHFPQEVSK